MSLLENIQHLSPVYTRYFDIFAERAEGMYIYDINGRRYLDFTSGIGVTNTGHCHPRIVAAIREQAGLLLHGQIDIVYHQPLLALIGALREVVPPGLDSFFFSNSGAEAVEASIKLARQATGRSDVIAFTGGFHGRTYGAMSVISSKSRYRAKYAPLPSGVHFAPYATCYTCTVAKAAGRDTAALSAAAPATSCCEQPLRQLRQMLATQVNPGDVAAMLVEPVQGEGGYIVPPASFLQGLRTICNEIGALLIVDEVQSGFGRTGRWWGHMHMDIVPDIMVMAKGIASGLPLSAIATRPEIMQRWQPGAHGTTYGGNALACVAAYETIAIIREEKLVEHADRQGALLRSMLREIQTQHPVIGDVRGAGLMVGMELVQPDGKPAAALAKQLVLACGERGLLVLTCGIYDNVLRFIPALTVSEDEINQAVEIVADSLAVARGA